MNGTFVDLLDRNEAHATAFGDRFDDVQGGQRPVAVSICCSDSRVLHDHLWGTDDPGQVFACSNIGNRVVQRTGAGRAVSGDVLYPLVHTGTETAVVVGHTGCGAVTATYDALRDGSSEPPGIEHCVDLLAGGLEDGVELLPEGVDRAGEINRLVEYNVDRQVEHLCASDAVPDAVDVAGVVYDFQDVYGGRRGEVHAINVDGEHRVEELRASHPEIADRVRRLWEY